MSWRGALIILSAALVVLVGFEIVDWDPIKTLCVAILALAVAVWPSG